MTAHAGTYGPEAFLDRAGNAVPSAVITIFELDGVTHASLYTDRDRTGPLANPLPVGVAAGAAGLDAGANGIFYAEPGVYRMVVTVAGTQVYAGPARVEVDAADISPGSIGAETPAGAQAKADAAQAFARQRANHTGTQLAATVSDFDTQVRTSRLDQLVAPTSDVSFNGHKATLLADPTAAQDAATRAWVLAQLALLTAGAPGTLDTFLEAYNQFLTDEAAVTALTSIVSGKLAAANNLSDVANAATALGNLGLSTFVKTLVGLADQAAFRTAIGAAASATSLAVLAPAPSGDVTGVTDTAAVNTAISGAAAGSRLVFIGTYYFKSPGIVVAGGKSYDFSRCTPVLVAGSNCNLITNSAVSTTATGGMDAASTAGSTAVTSAAFTVGNTGQPFVIHGAGPQHNPATGTVTGAGTGTLNSRVDAGCGTTNGSPVVTDTAIRQADVGSAVAGTGIPANAYVGAVIDGTSFDIHVAGVLTNATATGSQSLTFGGNAVYTMANTYVAVGPRDTDIEIIGGTWDSQTNNGAFTAAYVMRFRRVDRLKIRGARVKTTGNFSGTANAVYAINVGDATDVVIDDIDLNVARDGVHVEGPLDKVRITNIRGTTGDDFVAVDIGNYPGYEDCIGNVTDVEVDGLLMLGAKSGVAVQGHSSVFTLDRISVSNLKGSVVASTVRITDDANMTSTLVGTMTIDKVNVASLGSNTPLLLGATSITSLTVRDWESTNVLAWATVSASKIVKNLIVNGLRALNSPNAPLLLVSGECDDLSMMNLAVVPGGSSCTVVQAAATATLTRVQFLNVRSLGAVASSGAFFRQTNGASAVTVECSNFYLQKGTNPFVFGGTATLILGAGCFDTNNGSEINANNAAANVTVFGSEAIVYVGAVNGVNITGGSTVRVNCPGIRTSVTSLTPTAGDQLNATNAASAAVPAGAGPSVYDGSIWRPLKQPFLARNSVVLVAGTLAVADTKITANSVINLSVRVVGGTQGILSYANNNGVGFTINSSNAADTSTVEYQVVKY